MVPEGRRFPGLFRGQGVRGHRYHVFDEPRYWQWMPHEPVRGSWLLPSLAGSRFRIPELFVYSTMRERPPFGGWLFAIFATTMYCDSQSNCFFNSFYIWMWNRCGMFLVWKNRQPLYGAHGTWERTLDILLKKNLLMWSLTSTKMSSSCVLSSRITTYVNAWESQTYPELGCGMWRSYRSSLMYVTEYIWQRYELSEE